MKAAGYVPTSFQQKTIEEEQIKHRKRIETILQHNKKGKEQVTSSTNLKMSQQLQKNMKAMHNEKFQSIDKDNKFLLEKLIEISRKKPAIAEKKENAHSKSLHGTFRKKEMMRISMENEAFAKRLLAQQSTFDQKKLNKDYQKHQALLVQIKRVSTSPQKGQSKKLPPLTIEAKTPKRENLSVVKSPVAKDINKDQAASAPSRDEKTSTRLPESTKEVDNHKVEEVVSEVHSEKAIDEKKPEPEKVEEPKEEIKETEKPAAAEEIIASTVVEEKKPESQPEIQAQAEEEKSLENNVEKQPDSTAQIEEEIPKEEVKPAEPEQNEAVVKPEENNQNQNE